jgi:Cu(I)/Ag(I) efflux system membrane fusion protein
VAKEQEAIRQALANLTPEDRKLAEAQRVCPVTDKLLGTMGTPVKRTVLGQTVFVCCEGCDDAVQEKPEATLKKVEGLKKGK